MSRTLLSLMMLGATTAFSPVARLGLKSLSPSGLRSSALSPSSLGRRHIWLPNPLGLKMQSSSTSTSEASAAAAFPELNRIRVGDNRTPEQLAEEGAQLIQTILSVASQTPPQVSVRRTLQGTQALLRTGAELLQKFQTRGTTPTTQDLLDEAPATLRKLFERLGATYIKLGQFVASSPTLFPPEYVQEFQKCLDSTEPVPFQSIERIIQSEIKGKDIKSVFSFIDETPLATASIAQVHAARLVTGEDVVIKVQKPGVEALLKADLSFVFLSTKVLEFLNPEFKRLSLADITGDIRSTMLDEVDFTKEANNMAEFRAFLSKSGISDVVCPRTYPEASGKRILTMDRLYGKPLVDLDSVRSYTSNPEATLITALNTWTASVVGCNSFHADVHAGNLLVLQDGKVGFIDFGIVGKISPKTWQAVEGIAEGLAIQDYEKIAIAMVRLGATSEEVNIPGFADDLKRVAERIEKLDVEVMVAQRGDEFEAAVRTDDEEVTRILLDLVAVGQEYGVKFPRDFGLLLKQVLYFDRYTKLLAPDMDPLQDERVRSGIRRMSEQVDGPVIDV